MITIDAYQEFIQNVAIYPDRGENLAYPVLGLNGEAGEVAEKIKKVIRDKGNELDDETRNLILLELGDVLWYVTDLADVLGSSLHEVMQKNYWKLSDRKIREKLHGEGDER